MPKEGMVTLQPDTRRPSYELTQAGFDELRMLSSLGCTLAEIAAHLDVSTKWLVDYCAKNPDAERAREGGAAELKRKLRKAQLDLADTNATMAIFLGKQYLGQTEKQEVQVTKTVQVVGTLPDFKAAGEDWQRKFAPPPNAGLPQPAPPSPVPAVQDGFMDLTEVDYDEHDERAD